MITQDLCYIVDNENLDPRDRDLFFSGVEETQLLPNTATMVDVLVESGIFPSRGQAKKAGWKGKPIPPGFTEMIIGKLNHQITIFNPSSSWEEDQA